MITLYVALAAAALSGGGVHLLHRQAAKRDAAAAAAAAAAADAAAATGQSNVGVAGAVGDAAAGAVDAAKADDNIDADTRANIATWDATTVAVYAAVQPDANRATVALAGYLGCVSGSQGKGEGSAAYGCGKRGEALDATIAAMPVNGCPEAAPEPSEATETTDAP